MPIEVQSSDCNESEIMKGYSDLDWLIGSLDFQHIYRMYKYSIWIFENIKEKLKISEIKFENLNIQPIINTHTAKMYCNSHMLCFMVIFIYNFELLITSENAFRGLEL